MFIGTSNHTIDSKGRIVLPAKFRAQLGESFFVTRGFYDCVQVLSREEFERLCANIKEMPAKLAFKMQYKVISPAAEVTPNAQGRILIPQFLREAVGLTKDVKVVGVDNRVEIWDSVKFDKMLEEDFDDLSEALESFRL